MVPILIAVTHACDNCGRDVADRDEYLCPVCKVKASRARKPNPAAQALARKRWAGTTKEQRREATRKATAASPRTKKRAGEKTREPPAVGPAISPESPVPKDPVS